jgi:hypothetical protein
MTKPLLESGFCWLKTPTTGNPALMIILTNAAVLTLAMTSRMLMTPLNVIFIDPR